MKKEKWREYWLSSINRFTSYSFQREYWLSSNYHWSFTECMNDYFDDILSDLDYNHYLKIEWISLKEYEIIINWHSELNSYKSPKNNDKNDSEILKDDNWLKLLEKGKIVKKKLNQIISNKEKKFLNEIITQ